MTPLTEAQEKAVLELMPFARTRPKEAQVPAALDALIDSERWRKGEPDTVSGAQHLFHLTQGALLKGEHDLSIHAHTGFPVSVLTCDLVSLIRFNQRFGFAEGDALLKQTARALQGAFPQAVTVRIHADCFAVLGVPSSELEPTEALREQARAALAPVAAPFSDGRQGEPFPVDFTLGLLSLRIRNPSHWQVLGPLVWAEAERVHVLARSGQNPGVLERVLELDGAVQR